MRNVRQTLEAIGAYRCRPVVAALCGALVIVTVPATIRASHNPLEEGERCQLALGRSLAKYARDRARCVAKCYARAVEGQNPTSDCVPPFAGKAHECAERAEERLDRGYYYPECSGGHCPNCYQCLPAMPEIQFGYIEGTSVAGTEGWIDSISGTIFCDDSGSADGLTGAEESCRQGIAAALGDYAAAKTRCLYKCRKREAKGRIDAGVCAAASVTDSQTTECILAAQQEAAVGLAPCADPPECLAPHVANLTANADSGIVGVDPDVYCGIPTPCGDAFGLQCDGACPAGQACENVSGQCVCNATSSACGADGGAPACWGTCPPEQPICHDIGEACVCINY